MSSKNGNFEHNMNTPNSPLHTLPWNQLFDFDSIQVTKTFLTAIDIAKDSQLSSLLFYHYIDGGVNDSRTYTEEELSQLNKVISLQFFKDFQL